jgi:predicted CXXCH cytochrome family protein
MRRLLLALLLLAAALPARAAVDDLPCVVCHPSRDRVAYQLLSAVPGLRVGQESAQAGVCRSCHAGAVRDDRATLDTGGQHPVGVTAGAGTPKVLTLYGNRQIECGTCHSPHGEHPAARRWLRQEFAGGVLCATCHAGHQDRHLQRTLTPAQVEAVGRRGGRSGAAGEIECGTCHVPHGAAGPKLLIAPYGPEQDQLCRTCHGGIAVKGVAASSPGQPCASCHRPHSGETWQLSGGQAGPCVACHGDREATGEHPRATPACSECHSVHSPVRPGGLATGLLRLPTDGGMLCATCHAAVAGSHGAEIPLDQARGNALRGKELPLSGNTAGCATCHRAHGPRDEPLLRMPRTIICLYCHPDQNPFGAAGARAGVHPMAVPLGAESGEHLRESGGRVGPGGELACNSCHRTHGDGAAVEVACLTCHPGKGAQRGHAGDGDCTSCHAMHGAERQEHPCGTCHQELGAGPHRPDQPLVGAALPAVDPKGRMGMNGTLQCSTCHDPHGDAAPLLREASPTATCVACHPDKADMATGSHDLAAEGESLCGPCHPAHGASPPTGGDDPAASRCTECHSGTFPVTLGHSRQGQPPWRQLVGDLPLFDQGGERNPYGFMTCPTCHDVHAPADRRSMRAEERDPPELCLGCHQEKGSLLGSPHDPRQGKAAEGGAACGTCHPMHPAQEAELGAWVLPEGGQGTWNDRKCTPCHGSARDAPWGYTEATSHPVNVLLPKGMAAGELPLYDTLGGTAGRGLVCTTCHDLHGTPAGRDQALPYFLRQDPAGGGLCTGCHEKQTAVVGTAHDLDTDPDPVGPCSPCHVAHGASSPRALWWLEPAAGEYAPNRLCRSCHTPGGWAEGETQLLLHHMKDEPDVRSERGTIYLQRPMLLLDELALKSGAEPVIPLFDRNGTPGPDGNLQCVSCHEPHQWSPMGPFVKPGFGTLGPNVPTQFLRLGEAKQTRLSVCATCHPDDVEQRYRKYHQVWEDVGAAFH